MLYLIWALVITEILLQMHTFFFLGILYAREITRGNMIPEPVEFVALGANQVSEM